MAKSGSKNIATLLTQAGRDPGAYHGFVNTPLYRGSTVLFANAEALNDGTAAYTYGRRGTPTTRALEQAMASLEGGSRCFLAPSGLAAISTVLLAYVKAGAEILITDSVYEPTRRFASRVLERMGVSIVYYDPLIGDGIGRLITAKTTLIFTESPGSQTFEIQDIPAICRQARARDIPVAMDNTWATPLYFKPFQHGVNISIQSATKYIIGHADGLLGMITCDESSAPIVGGAHGDLGVCAGPEDCYFALRGLRSLGVRLERHWHSGLEMAQWLSQRPEVAHVLHPALPSFAGHAIWQRDFLGAAGLFSIILKPCPAQAVHAMLNRLELFGMGYSWGGFESLIVPFDCRPSRKAGTWQPEGPSLRLHIGLEDVDDLKSDLEHGFAAMRDTL